MNTPSSTSYTAPLDSTSGAEAVGRPPLIRPLRIGALVIPFPVLLAPMAGYTDASFRLLCSRFGCGMAFTEMVNAMGLRRRCPRTLFYLETDPREGPLGAHLYGSHPAILADAAAAAAALGRFQLIDLNAGCPVPKIMRRGDGAGLLKDPDKLAAIVRAMRSVVRLPLTVKTRIGLKPDRINISEVAQAVEENGADALIIHARAASVRHAGKPDWEWLARIKSERKIPIIGNGGVNRAEHAAEMLRQTGVDGVMIGRAAIGRPWIFRQIRELWAGQTPFQPTMDERLAIMREHLAGLEQNCALEIKVLKSPRLAAEQAACVRFRSHVTRYLLGYRRLRYFTRQLNQLDSFEKMLSAAGEVLAAGRMTDENTGSDETSA